MTTATLDSAVCPSCKDLVDRGCRFCGQCGCDLVTGVALQYEDAYEDGASRRLVWGAAAVLSLLVVGAFLLSLAAFLSSEDSTGSDPELIASITALEEQLEELEAKQTAFEATAKAVEDRLNAAEETAETAAETAAGGLAPLADRVLKSVFTVQTRTSFGTGWVAWTEGDATYVITANHVVEDSPSAFITLDRRDGSWSGEIVRTDVRNDLAVIRISGTIKDAEPLWQDPRPDIEPRPGDKLLLVGSPYGLDGTVTTGIVSRVTKREIQTDAAANPGNSGGPALDEQGRVVGVLLAGGGQNLNFAVPMARACVVIRDC